MATLTSEKTRAGKGQAKVTIDGTDFGVLTGDIIFTPENEEVSYTLGNMLPAVQQGGSWKTRKGGLLKFSTATVDKELIARAYGEKYSSNDMQWPLTEDYIQKPVFTIVAYSGRFLADSTPLTDQAFNPAQTGDGTTKDFADCVTDFTGRKLHTVSVHDEDDAQTITFDNEGTASGDTGTGTNEIDFYTGTLSVSFATAPTDTKAIQWDGTPKYEYEDTIKFYAGEFVGAAPEVKYSDGDQTILEFTVKAVWDEDKCTAANGLVLWSRNQVSS